MNVVAPDTKPSGIAAVVAFGLPPCVVDGLIEELIGTDVEPARWFVFDGDMGAMGALNEVWQRTIHIVMCAVPYADETVAAAALEILSSEGVPMDRCAWLHSTANPVARIDRVVGVVLPVDINSASYAENLVLRLTDWQGVRQGRR
jgi:hypothetical protein